MVVDDGVVVDGVDVDVATTFGRRRPSSRRKGLLTLTMRGCSQRSCSLETSPCVEGGSDAIGTSKAPCRPKANVALTTAQ